ncbi:MAG: hypothetical protein AAB884_00835 [Patescibacteria group bacterium]
MKHQLTTIVLGEVPKAVRGEIFPPHAVKKAPHYFEKSVPHQLALGQEKVNIGGKEIIFQLKGYPPDILLIQASLDVPNIFSSQILDLEDKIFAESYKILKDRGGSEAWSEMYSFFAVSEYETDPEHFVKEHASIIASLLKSEKFKLDEKEVEYTLQTQIKYANNDLTIVDWDGAFLFDPKGDHESSIELLVLANLQLLRHRILDRQLDERLAKTAKLTRVPSRKLFLFKNKELSEGLREVIKNRTTSISEFQVLEREIKLIGDWYSARLYDLATKKFKLAEWRISIKDKLESLEDIFSIVAENFSVSGKERVEWVQIIGFFILQIGWFLLIVLEFFYFTR